MVSNILDLSKLKENKFELNCRPENIKHLVIQAVDLHQTKIEQKGIFIDCFQSSPNVFPEEF
jgi:signal transduction histidine kinase